jgi:hypothetical protein
MQPGQSARYGTCQQFDSPSAQRYAPFIGIAVLRPRHNHDRDLHSRLIPGVNGQYFLRRAGGALVAVNRDVA